MAACSSPSNFSHATSSSRLPSARSVDRAGARRGPHQILAVVPNSPQPLVQLLLEPSRGPLQRVLEEVVLPGVPRLCARRARSRPARSSETTSCCSQARWSPIDRQVVGRAPSVRSVSGPHPIVVVEEGPKLGSSLTQASEGPDVGPQLICGAYESLRLGVGAGHVGPGDNVAGLQLLHRSPTDPHLRSRILRPFPR